MLQKFKRGKLALYPTSKEAYNSLMEWCESQGLHWDIGLQASEIVWLGGKISTDGHGFLFEEDRVEDIPTQVFDGFSRGFRNVTGWNVKIPQRSTKDSAGYDIASGSDIVIPPGEIVYVPTGIKAYMNTNEFLGIYPRSSLGKSRLMLVNNVAVIDSDYYNNPDNEGHIQIPLWNFGDKPQLIHKGTRIVQGIYQEYHKTSSDNATGSRNGGFGSTGK